MTMATPIFDKFLGDMWTVPENMPAKFEVRSFEYVGSRQRSSSSSSSSKFIVRLLQNGHRCITESKHKIDEPKFADPRLTRD